jgi:glycosyltransferase involved in cell wall biosynthesis
MAKKIAIIITHPIQYYVPVFQQMSKDERIQLKVFYTWGEAAKNIKFDPDFGKEIDWDIPLLSGYDYYFTQNISTKPGSHHAKGIINPNLKNEIESWGTEALLVFGYAYVSHFEILRYFKGKIPIYFRGDSTLLDKRNPVKELLKWIYLKWVYRFVDYAFYVGTENKKYFLKYGLTEKQLIFAPHAIDNERFAINREEEVIILRNSLGIKADEVLILFAGKLISKKNPQLLLNAFLNTELKNAHLLFVGDGALKLALNEIVSSHKKENCIHFLEFVNQTKMPVIYQASNLFCLPSQGPGETWGLAVNEAMAASKAILVSNKVGCATDLVKSNGMTFNHDEIKDLENCLSILCINQTNLSEKGKLSKEIINNWTIVVQVTKMINSIING